MDGEDMERFDLNGYRTIREHNPICRRCRVCRPLLLQPDRLRLFLAILSSQPWSCRKSVLWGKDAEFADCPCLLCPC